MAINFMGNKSLQYFWTKLTSIFARKSELSNVATTGSYNDLSNKPTIPTVPTNISAFTNDTGYITKSGSITGNAATATTASKIGTGTLGSTTQPVYIKDGVPTAISYTIEKSVPSNAQFTDNNTTYTFATGDANGQIKVTPSGGTAQNIGVKGLGSLAYKSSLAASDVGALATSLKGAANGVAELDANGLVPSSQLPSYVDDVLEYSAKASFPATGETGKIYVDTATNKTYRWSGSAYAEISASLALGTTSSTAYRGDYGNTAYTHATDSSRLTTAKTSGLYKVASTAQGHIASLTAVTKDDITGLGIPGSDTNTTYTFATGDSNGQIKVTPSGGSATNISVKGLAASAYKAVDTSIAAASTSTNVPTSQAVAAFVEGKGYKTTDNNTTYTLTQDSADGHKITLTPSSGTATTITIPDNNTTYSAATTSANGLMSSADKTKMNNTNVAWGTCSTAAGTAEKVITISGNTNWALAAGSIIGVKFSATNTAQNPTFNVNSTGAKSVWYNTAVLTTGNLSYAGVANRPMYYMYDGAQYVCLGWSIESNDNTVPSAYCSTAAGTAAKTATCSGYVLLSKSYIHVIITTANTSATALTLNINSKGAKPIYINGTASSTSNYTLPAGSYLVYYDGTNYYFRTDGKITGSITGDAATVNGLTVQTAVPTNAKFTDTTYTFSDGLSASGTTVSNSGVRSVATGSSNGTISVNTNGTAANVSVKGLAAAAYKAVDTSISAASTSANLPTSAAVATFVEGKGYKTTDNNTTYTFATGDANGQIKVTPSGGTAQNISVKGLGSLAYSSATIPTVHSGTMTPDSTLGKDGDLYVLYSGVHSGGSND